MLLFKAPLGPFSPSLGSLEAVMTSCRTHNLQGQGRGWGSGPRAAGQECSDTGAAGEGLVLVGERTEELGSGVKSTVVTRTEA